MNITDLSDQLRELGLAEGDVLYLRAALKSTRIPKAKIGRALLTSIFDVIGPSGTLIVPAFVRQYPVWKRSIPVSTQPLAPYTGALTDIVLAEQGVIISDHPTHPFAGIGAQVRDILDGHTGEKSAFEPMRSIAKKNGLMMLIGCVESSPGFSTVHLAQFDLGLTQQHYLRHLFRVRLPDEAGRKRYFRPIEAPGCSMSFSKFYDLYRDFRQGHFGMASAVAVRAGAAFQLEKEVLSENPLFIDCGDRGCPSCNLRGYNKSAIPQFLFALAPRLVSKIMR